MNKILEQALRYSVSRCLSILRPIRPEAIVHVVVEFGSHLGLLVPESAVPVVLDRIVGPSEEHIGELGPAILGSHLENEEDPIFLDTPLIFHY